MANMESGSGNAERAQSASDAGRAQGASGSDTGLIALLIQINKALHRRTSEELLGMRLKQFLLLGYVGDRGAVSQQELETGLVMDANSVVLLLNETEATGWSVRKRDPADRRRHMVELTDAGKLAVERAEKAREGIEDEVLSDLSADERKALRKLLKRVLAGLLRVPAESHAQA
jgi:DNA-binding MarR family transcriptional regulator